MIAVLPPHVIDQIAAGEVIERPASVVKELVDNAIDAGATAITVEVASGGRALVRVCDDGSGMSAADARLALQRHATSKLRAVDELWGLATMGFRGEALPAIASVSRMTLVTRRPQDLAATRIVVEHGAVTGVDEVGAPPGTTIEVADLLANLPARLKFLKGEATEASHVTELVSRVAMAHPALHVRLRHNGRTALDVPPDRDGFARVRALLGTRVASRMMTATGEEGGVRVVAYLAAPELAQTTARGVQLYVGGRPIRDRGLLHAIAMGYGELVPRGRYPLAVVLVDAPAGTVDINVHPQKLEVRFSDAPAVCAAVRHVVAAAVAQAAWRSDSAMPMQMMAITSVTAPALPFDGLATPLAQRYAQQLSEARVTQRSFGGWDPSTTPLGSGSESGVREWVHRVKSAATAPKLATRAAEAAADRALRELERELPFARTVSAPIADGSRPIAAPTLARGTQPGFFTTLRYLGQLDLTYLVCEAAGEMVLIDQHAAHERVELARLRERHTAQDVPTQKLLFPSTIDASPAQVELVGTVADVLAQVGFEAEAFGAQTIAIKAVPAGIRHGEPSQLLRRMLDNWLDDHGASASDRLERVLAEIACHSVVRAGDRLSVGEAEALLRSLDANDLTSNPHGKPMLLRIPLVEIARRFGR
jgi:DNA mismatch repair protein MutL